jgi:DNA polymerase-4
MKKIIHVDMDCFYAQVEMRDNPSLKGKPVAVGGMPGTRSVLCTSNYEARKYGVRAAMPTDLAVKKCKNLIVIPPDFKKYQEASHLIHNVFAEFTDLIEPLSLDEAFLDVAHYENASLIIGEIQKRIYEETNLTSSVGLAPNKFLAKIASDWNKPNGLFVIRPHEIEKFVANLDVKLIPGVGKVGLQALTGLNIKTCSDILKVDPIILHETFGKFGIDLINYAKGIDHRNVEGNYERKSLSVETTFLKDTFWNETLESEFDDILTELEVRIDNFLKDEPSTMVKKVFAKAKFNDFISRSRETVITLDANFKAITYRDQFKQLLLNVLAQKEKPVRLIGLGVRFQRNDDQQKSWQLPLFNNFS